MTNAQIDEWIEREFTGYGAAIRRETDPPIPGEPFMSMVIAKRLARELACAIQRGPKAPSARHRYAPHHKWPWFCEHCGYTEHELLMHEPRLNAS